MAEAVASIDHTERTLDVPEPAPEADRSRIGRRTSQWRLTTFGPASEEPYRRRVIDRVRIVIAGVLLAWMTFHTTHATLPERDLYHLFNDLPTGWFPLIRVIYLAGALWAVGVATSAALIARRWRLARDLVVAGIASWIIADAIGAWVAGEGFHRTFHAVSRLSYESPHFPTQRIALTVAMVATASPYLTRPSRRVGQVLILLMVLSAFYLGTGIPVDVLGGVFLGWGIAAVVHLIFGSPGGRPTAGQVSAALNEVGIEARGVRLAREQPQQATLMVGTDDIGPLRIRVLGRDEA